MRKEQRTSALRSATIAAGLLVAASAHGQSSVTLYGILDAGILYTNRSVDPTTGASAGKRIAFTDAGMTASRIGVKGVEDLGGGLHAEFVLESGIDLGNGGYNLSNGNFFGRQAWVGLDNPYGNVKLGLQYSPFMLAAVQADPRGGALFGDSGVSYVGNVFGTGIFTPNAISYTSPRIAGFQASGLMSLGNAPGSALAGRAFSASITYGFNDLFIAAAIYDGKPGSTTNTPVPTSVPFDGRLLGAKYSFGSLSVMATFTKVKIAGALNDNVYTTGFEYVATPGVIVNGNVSYSSDRNHTYNHSILAGMGLEYGMSKRTWLYAQAALVDNHGAMNTGIAISGSLYAPPGRTVGVDVGIRHSF
ncbi:porin [Burkholderia sp. MSh2]|uniref:Porin n=1 Tax=Burkholderia paludis TaxID=1506587 RepID=A0A6J5F5X5_9BURK|nr:MULTISPECIES: porin [Burkholderia]KEZ00760.1 porin [Burkholderia sp. MSh2]CAB3774199.1 Outer membrane porin protein 32 [Burkholderia paludis]VWC48541.1 porin [Burkholderia paludis]